jgi:hypothetical protein
MVSGVAHNASNASVPSNRRTDFLAIRSRMLR